MQGASKPTVAICALCVQIFFASLLLVAGASAAEKYERLPALKIDPSGVTVSGISAGAFMAVQMHLADSSLYSGAGIVAGGVYNCSEGSIMQAFQQCMYHPERIDVKSHVDFAIGKARDHHIDPLENLRDDRVYIYHSDKDDAVHAPAGNKIEDFYAAFVDKSHITFRHDIPSTHGFPTLDYGAKCMGGREPWLLKCGVDVAGEILHTLYPGKMNDPVVTPADHMHKFAQNEFGPAKAAMHEFGFVYIPSSCANGATCKLHVMLHGCKANSDYVGDVFYMNAGYNRWAESNQIIVLYPQVAKTNSNPNSCFDWWGYTASDFVSKASPQILAIHSMVDRLSGKR